VSTRLVPRAFGLFGQSSARAAVAAAAVPQRNASIKATELRIFALAIFDPPSEPISIRFGMNAG
jgi:hypothetical protein